MSTMTMTCTFSVVVTGIAECSIEYGTDEMFVDLPNMDMGSAVGNIVVVNLTATLEGNTTYY